MPILKSGPCKRKLALFCCGLTMVSSGVVQMGIAATETNATFVAHYEHRAQVAAQLMATVQPLPSNSGAGVTNIQSAVTKLNQEIALLYTADESVAEQAGGSAGGNGGTTSAPLPPAAIASNVKSILRDAKSGITKEEKAYATAIKHPGSRGKAWSKSLSAEVKSARSMAGDVNKTTKAVNAIIRRPAFRKTTSLQVNVLQTAIEQAQASVIELLNAWLWLADAAWAKEQPTTATGLTYVTSTIAVPATGQSPATDAVGMQPQVTDAAGQSLPDWGTYRLQGVVGHTGVNVDPLIGTVTVHPDATPGAYTIVYTQGRAVEHALIQVVVPGGSRS